MYVHFYGILHPHYISYISRLIHVQYLYFVLEHVHVLNSAYTGPNITDGHWTITDHFCYMSDHAYKLSDKNVRAKSLE